MCERASVNVYTSAHVCICVCYLNVILPDGNKKEVRVCVSTCMHARMCVCVYVLNVVLCDEEKKEVCVCV